MLSRFNGYEEYDRLSASVSRALDSLARGELQKVIRLKMHRLAFRQGHLDLKIQAT